MTVTRIVNARTLAVLSLLLGLGGCAVMGGGDESFPVPGDRGLYVLDDDDELRPLDGSPEWETETWSGRSRFDTEVGFVIRHPALADSDRSFEEIISLERVGWVRSEITPEGDIRPASGSRWVASGVDDLQVPLHFRSMASRDDVVHAFSTRSLEPGLYALHLRTRSAQVSARLGVQWPETDQAAYSGETCVDRYIGDQPRYRLCSEQADVVAARWFKLYLVNPKVQRTADGRTLVVEGVVANKSGKRRRVPLLEAQLRSADGEVLDRWQFDPGASELEAGKSVSFRTERGDPPPGLKDVNVRFVPASR